MSKKQNVLGDVGNEKSSLSLDGVTPKADVTEVRFLDTLAGAQEGAAAISAAQNGSVRCWTEEGVQYIAGDGGVVGGNSCAELFAGYANVTAIRFDGNLDTSHVTNMRNLFGWCKSLKALDLSGWDTSRVTDMRGLFWLCGSLTSLDVSGWDTSNVTSMRALFQRCGSLTALDLSGWDTSRLTSMRTLFFGCGSLTALDVSRWDTSNVTDMSGMFYHCAALRALDLSGWDTARVTNLYGMFHGCSALTEFDPAWLDTSHADTTEMYKGTRWE